MAGSKTTYSFDVWLALGLVYVIWGSTYLAIRFAVESIPPFFMAGTRFLTSGIFLYGFTRLRGVPAPKTVHWKSAAVISFFLLVIANGGVCWAEQKVPSGITALMVGTVPLWIVLLQWVWKGQGRPGWKVWPGMALGLTGIVVLAFSKGNLGSAPVDVGASLLLVGTSLAWAVGSLYSREAPLPASALLGTSMEMITGGVMQLLTGLLLGEQAGFHPGAMTLHSIEAWVYLTFVGSLIGFTSYIWVLQKATPSLASTYAFVNPVIAVFLGWLWAGEPMTAPVFGAAGLIVAAVAFITLSSDRRN